MWSKPAVTALRFSDTEAVENQVEDVVICGRAGDFVDRTQSVSLRYEF